MATLPGNAWRWFRDVAVAPIPTLPTAAEDWTAMAALEAASGHRLRCRAVSDDDLGTLARLAARHLGVELGPDAVLRLLAAEWVALAAARPGAAPPEPRSPTLGAIFAAADADRAPLLAWALGDGPGPELPGARAGAVRVGADRAVAAATGGTNWLPRPPLPPAFYGVDRPPSLVDADPVDRPLGWRHHLEVLARAPAAWRVDAWFDLLGRLGPLAAVLPLGPPDEPLFGAAIADTPFAEALAFTLAEKLAVEGFGPDRSETVARLTAALRLDSDDLRLFCEGRDWIAGEVDLRRPAVRAGLVDPLRRALIAGGEVSGVLARAARIGGDALLGRLRDELVRDGTLSVGEWEALSPRASAG